MWRVCVKILLHLWNIRSRVEWQFRAMSLIQIHDVSNEKNVPRIYLRIWLTYILVSSHYFQVAYFVILICQQPWDFKGGMSCSCIFDHQKRWHSCFAYGFLPAFWKSSQAAPGQGSAWIAQQPQMQQVQLVCGEATDRMYPYIFPKERNLTRWFQIFVIFIPTWGNHPFWLIFFEWVETTNQLTMGVFPIVVTFQISCHFGIEPWLWGKE